MLRDRLLGECVMLNEKSSLPAPVVLFLHLPKTAGQTLNRIVYQKLGSSDLETDHSCLLHRGVYHYPGPHPPYGFFKEPDLGLAPQAAAVLERRPRAVVGHFAYGLHRLVHGPSTYVTVLRNPIDRLSSLYHHLKPEMSLEEFVTDYRVSGFTPDQTRLIGDNDQTRRISGLEPPFRECDGETLATAKSNLASHFAAVGVTDRFDESVVAMMIALGCGEVTHYWPVNLSSARSKVPAIAPDVASRILELNSLDAELYRFANELLSKQVRQFGDLFQSRLAALRKGQQLMFERVTKRNQQNAAQAAIEALQRVGGEGSQLKS
jgi:hypothetical protein